MKKGFALLIAAVTLLVSLFGVSPAADTSVNAKNTTESYVPNISYTNVCYADDLALMFAVPVPADLADGASVKVLVWKMESDVYSYTEGVTTSTSLRTATIIEAEKSTVNINGAQHYVFKYYGLSADMMTDVVYARAVLVGKDNVATAYGKVIDYSIVEYIETAKGSFNGGAPVIENGEVLELLDSILDFGALAQDLLGGVDPYTPNGYFANDELHKIWITPVVAGKKQEKAFGGFFKYEEGGYAKVFAPFFDGFEIVSYKDADGNLLTDANTDGYDKALGFQINAVDSDVEITVEYGTRSFKKLSAEDFGEGFLLNNVEKTAIGDADIIKNLPVTVSTPFTYIKIGSIIRRINFSGEACVPKTESIMNYYHGFRTVADPDNPDNLVFLVTTTNDQPIMSFTYITTDELKMAGYGDTAGKALTFEFEVGKPHEDAIVTTAGFSLKRDYRQNPFPVGYENTDEIFELFRVKNNKVYILNGVSSEVENGAEICELPNTGLIKVAITVFDTGVIKGYYSNESGEMVEACELNLVMTDTFLSNQALHEANLADNDPINDNDLIAFESFANWLSMSKLSPNWYLAEGTDPNSDIENAVVTINGEGVPVKKPNAPADAVGVEAYNVEALRIYAERNYSFLLNNFKFICGDIYE